MAHLGNFNPDSADGTEKTIAGLVSWLPRLGVDVEVWQPARGTTRVSSETADGVTVWQLPAYAPPTSFAFGLPRAAREFIVSRGREGAVTCVHFHSGFVPENPAAAALLDVPYVVAPNGMYSPANLSGRDARFKRVWLRLREMRYLRRAALLHAVSEGEAEALRVLLPEVPLRLVPNALDLPDAPAGAPGAGAKTLLFLGRLAVEQKGLDLLLHAFARFVARGRDTTTRLVLVGPDYRNGVSRLKWLIDDLGLHQRVELREAVFGAAKWQLLGQAHAFVHPSRWDGLPFSVLEALAARRPVLVTPGTNLAGLVDAYGAGLVAPTSVEAIADGLAALAAMPAEGWSRMGDRGRALVEDHFTWAAAAGQMADAYDELAGTSATPMLGRMPLRVA